MPIRLASSYFFQNKPLLSWPHPERGTCPPGLVRRLARESGRPSGDDIQGGGGRDSQEIPSELLGTL